MPSLFKQLNIINKALEEAKNSVYTSNELNLSTEDLNKLHDRIDKLSEAFDDICSQLKPDTLSGG